MNKKNLLTLFGIPALIIVLITFANDKNFQTAPQDVLTGSSQIQENNIPPPTEGLDPTKTYKAVLRTTQGDITIELFSLDVPVASTNFVYLSKLGFYNGTIFHRVIKDFMIQGGTPKEGEIGPGYQFKNEVFEGQYLRGTVATANNGPDTNGSQFFIVQKDQPNLPKNYVIFGKVVEGMDIVDTIAKSEVTTHERGELSVPISPAVINSVEIIEEGI